MAQSTIKPNPIWLRELDEKGNRKVTLRRNVSKETVNHEGIEDEIFEYDEVDVSIIERDNMQQFIEDNFGNLFDLGLEQNANIEIDKLDAECGENINKGFYLDLGDGLKHFNCKLYNQANIDSLKDTALMVREGFALPEGVLLEYNTSSDECLHDLTVDQVVALWTAKNIHIYKYRKECEVKKKLITGDDNNETV